MKIQEIQTSKIKPYDKNIRSHPEAQIDRLAESIKEFGFNQPIVVDENYEIIIGHGRFFAAQKLGLEKCPVVVASWLDEVKKRAYRLVDNEMAEESNWHFGNLKFELGFLETKLDFPKWNLQDLHAKTEKLNFNPMVAPEQSEEKVTSKDIEKTATDLAGAFERETTMLEFCCPNCAHVFTVKKDWK